MAIHIVLVEPEIPQNTGNIARTCAATNITLHLVEPLGFSTEEKHLKRAGLDYWQHVTIEIHKSLDAFMAKYEGKTKYLATTKGGQIYDTVQFKDEDMILFGRESAGLPKAFIEENKEFAIRIPMGEATRLRSLNLSNCANIIAFEALRQLGFPNLK